jgi:hypothetical protein
MRSAHINNPATNIVQRNKETIFTSDEGRKYEGKEEIMFGYVSKLARTLRGPSIEEREMAYLNQSVDRIDLEYRQRQVERGMFRRNTLPYI